MKILSLFTHPHVVPNLYEYLSYVEHKRRYFEEWEELKKTVNGPHNFHSISFPTMEVNREQQLFGSSKFFKVSSFVFSK